MNVRQQAAKLLETRERIAREKESQRLAEQGQPRLLKEQRAEEKRLEEEAREKYEPDTLGPGARSPATRDAEADSVLMNTGDQLAKLQVLAENGYVNSRTIVHRRTRLGPAKRGNRIIGRPPVEEPTVPSSQRWKPSLVTALERKHNLKFPEVLRKLARDDLGRP